MGKEEKKKMEQKDELTNSGQRFPVEQVSNTGKPTKKQVKAAVKRQKSFPLIVLVFTVKWMEPEYEICR